MTQSNFTIGQEVKIVDSLTNEIFNGVVCPHCGYGNKETSVWVKFLNIQIPFSVKTGKAYGKLAQFNKNYSIVK